MEPVTFVSTANWHWKKIAWLFVRVVAIRGRVESKTELQCRVPQRIVIHYSSQQAVLRPAS